MNGGRVIRIALAFIAGVTATFTALADPLPRPGQRFEIRPSDMPAPFATGSAGNRPSTITLGPFVVPDVPEGFTANRFAEGLAHARWMTVAPGGEVFLAEPRAGRVSLLIDRDLDGKADEHHIFASGLNRPHGLALRGEYLYVADPKHVWRYRWKPGLTHAEHPPQPVTPATALGGSGGHWTRNIAFSPDGKGLFAAIGSAGNIGEDPPPRAAIIRFEFDEYRGEAFDGRVYASGLRNPVGIAFHPDTGQLYTVVNERDGLGDELVPDYLTSVLDGGFYGWPYAYIGPNPQPDFAERRPDLVRKAIVPDLLFRSHSAPLGLVFAKDMDVPAAWKDDAFVALHGSWNAAEPRGYMVVRVPFANGRPEGWYESFATGFHVRTKEGMFIKKAAEVWGRPAGLAVAADGSLLIADDVANVIWRVSRNK
ncbi:MAG: sorbosone dehydrogenase family protein [Proteobacteria bacterium]|nr:sorbosone dehydrogenase family protein [Pseudomonadota bacterium]